MKSSESALTPTTFAHIEDEAYLENEVRQRPIWEKELLRLCPANWKSALNFLLEYKAGRDLETSDFPKLVQFAIDLDLLSRLWNNSSHQDIFYCVAMTHSKELLATQTEKGMVEFDSIVRKVSNLAHEAAIFYARSNYDWALKLFSQGHITEIELSSWPNYS